MATIEVKISRAQVTRFVDTIRALTLEVQQLTRTVGDLADRVMLVQPKPKRKAKPEPELLPDVLDTEPRLSTGQ